MNKEIRTVRDLIGTWSEEEREALKDNIAEALEREKSANEFRKGMGNAEKSLDDAIKTMILSLQELLATSIKMRDESYKTILTIAEPRGSA